MTEIEQEWRSVAMNELPLLDPQLSIKLLYKLLAHKIYTIEQITLPKGTKLMSPGDCKLRSTKWGVQLVQLKAVQLMH